MSTSKQLNLPPVPVQSVSLARESAVSGNGKALSHDQETRLTSLLAASVEATGCTEKEAALTQGYEPTYWSRIKSGEKHAYLDRVSRLPESVQRAFVTRWAFQLRLRVSEGDSQKHAAANLLKAAADFLAESA